jgi:hypothetical protein
MHPHGVAVHLEATHRTQMRGVHERFEHVDVVLARGVRGRPEPARSSRP